MNSGEKIWSFSASAAPCGYPPRGYLMQRTKSFLIPPPSLNLEDSVIPQTFPTLTQLPLLFLSPIGDFTRHRPAVRVSKAPLPNISVWPPLSTLHLINSRDIRRPCPHDHHMQWKRYIF